MTAERLQQIEAQNDDLSAILSKPFRAKLGMLAETDTCIRELIAEVKCLQAIGSDLLERNAELVSRVGELEEDAGMDHHCPSCGSEGGT